MFQNEFGFADPLSLECIVELFGAYLRHELPTPGYRLLPFSIGGVCHAGRGKKGDLNLPIQIIFTGVQSDRSSLTGTTHSMCSCSLIPGLQFPSTSWATMASRSGRQAPRISANRASTSAIFLSVSTIRLRPTTMSVFARSISSFSRSLNAIKSCFLLTSFSYSVATFRPQ